MTRIDFAMSFSQRNNFQGTNHSKQTKQFTDQIKEAPNTTLDYLPYETNLAP